MAMVKHDDEKDLQRKICGILNKGGYNFQKGNDAFFCDIVDYNIKAFGEIKTNGKFAPQQIIYGLAKEDIHDAAYIILANEYELRVFKTPDFEIMAKFARSVSADLSRSPSSLHENRFIEEGFKILGTHDLIYTYKGDFKIDEKNPCIFLDDNNYEYFQIILTKYRISAAEFIDKFAKTFANKSRLFIKNDGLTIFDQESGNEVKAHRKITNEFDRMLIRSTRVKAENIEKIIHKIDTLSPIDVRRKRGKYWSNLAVSEIATELVRDLVDPTFIFEPFVGGGSLVRDIVPEVKGVVNDIDGGMVGLLEKEWEGYGWGFKKENFLTTPIADVMEKWGLPKETERFLIYTNPPFGTVSTNKMASKKGEINELNESRKNEIQYGAEGKESKFFGDIYGRGDLCIPSIAHIIEIVKRRGSGFIAFFSPFAMMLGRKRYNKILSLILEDFNFIYGEVFPGSMFNGVAKNVSISFTIWEFKKGCNHRHKNLRFTSYEKEYRVKGMTLLKDGWRYRDGSKYVKTKMEDAIGAFRSEKFNAPGPKTFSVNVKDGSGAEISPDNVKIPMNVLNVPDELVYGLFSACVGKSSATTYPMLFNDCYTHLPDFSRSESVEILSYAVMYAISREISNGYTEGKIGFVGMNRIFKFGGDRLTKGAQYLIDTFGSQPVGEKETIKSVFDKLKAGKDPDEIDKSLRIYIRGEIQKRLDLIGYWDYLPIPDIGSGDDDEVDPKPV
jgi:hypothetical protein